MQKSLSNQILSLDTFLKKKINQYSLIKIYSLSLM